MWSGSGSERTRSITGLNFKGGPSVAPNLADSGIKGLRKKGGRFKAGGGRWPYYAPNPLRGGAAKGLGINPPSSRSCGTTKGALKRRGEEKFAPQLRDPAWAGDF